jgi:thiol-disulfide isomerase/thioredoxin
MDRIIANICKTSAAAGLAALLGVVASHAAPPPRSPLTHSLRAFDGRSTSIESMRGEVVILSFWASWCRPCRKELHLLQDWNRNLGAPGTRLLAVSIDRDLRKAEKLVKEEALDLPFFHDGPDGLAKTLALPALPCTIVLDRSGNVVHVAEGAGRETFQELRRVVEQIAADPSWTSNAAAQEQG